MYKYIGVFADEEGLSYRHRTNAKPGDLIFEDISEDGKIDGNDRILID